MMATSLVPTLCLRAPAGPRLPRGPGAGGSTGRGRGPGDHRPRLGAETLEWWLERTARAVFLLLVLFCAVRGAETGGFVGLLMGAGVGALLGCACTGFLFLALSLTDSLLPRR